MSRPIRVLCLHGWRTNGRVLQHQTLALREALGPKAEFVYLDAPWAASGPTSELVRSFYGEMEPFYQWWDAIQRKDSETCHYEGLEVSLDFLVGQIQAFGTVDVVLGFSQGAAMTTLLTAHYLSKCGYVPWKACVLIGGFYPYTAETKELLDAANTSVDGAIDVPSVHVVGRADPLSPKSDKLVQSFTRIRRVRFEHEEGHKFPSSLKHRKLYTDIAQEVLTMTGQAWK